MIRIILLISILSSTLDLFSQVETKFKVKKSFSFIEEYYVLKDNKEIKEGSYVKYQQKLLGIGQYGFAILETGIYKNNVRDSIWEFYYDEFPINSIKEKGNYRNGIKEGEWVTYYLLNGVADASISYHNKNKRKKDTILLTVNHDIEKIRSNGVFFHDKKIGLWRYYKEGELYLEFNHSSNEVKYDLHKIYTIKDSLNILERPHFIGGNDFLTYYLNKTTSPKPNDHRIGVVHIEFTIDEFGTAKNFIIKENSSNKSFGKYILNKVINLPHEWIPSFSNGKANESTYWIEASLELTNMRNSHTVSYDHKTYTLLFNLAN
jgi:hypothetical protein